MHKQGQMPILYLDIYNESDVELFIYILSSF
jgi:hypothetical protein